MENEKEKLEKLREIIGEILYGINSDFKYRGHGYNLGMWSTSDEDELKWAALEKPNGPNEIDIAMFRVTVCLPNRFGIQIKVEMFPSSIYELDSTNHRMKDNEIEEYENSLPIDAEKIIHNYAYQMKSANELNCNTVMKKDRIRITESQLEKVIKDTMKRILREH